MTWQIYKLNPRNSLLLEEYFSIMEQFDSSLSSVIDSTLGLRCRLFGYQYSEIIRSLMSIYFCGGSCIEDVTTHLMNHLSLHPTLRTCSSDTILRAIKELTQGNLSYTSDTSKNYDSNTTDTLTASLQVEQAVACTIVSLGWHIGVIEDARHHLCEFPEYLSGTLYVLAGAPPPPPVLARVACKVLLHDGVLAFGMVSWVRCDQFPIHVDFY